MKTLTTPVADEAAAAQSGWCEVYDLYLRKPIVGLFDQKPSLRTSLVSFWGMDEPSGVPQDSFGTNNFTAFNSPTSAEGHCNKAVQFTAASSQYLQLAANTDLEMGAVPTSFSFWVWLDSAGDQQIFKKYGAFSEYDFRLQDGKFQFWLRMAGVPTGKIAVNYGTVPTGEWIFVCIWSDTVNLTIEVNRTTTDVLSLTDPLDTDATADLYVGKDPAAGLDYFDGRLDQLGIWKRVLTGEERQWLYENCLALITPTLRLTTLPGGLNFFTPPIAPEPLANRNAAQFYNFWPSKRESVKGNAKFSDDKITIAFSNVTTAFAALLAGQDWYDTPILIRKVPTSIASPTAADCVILFSGLIDSARTTNEIVQFSCSSDLSTFNVSLPRENMHPACRFQWGDDQCTALRLGPNNYKIKTAGGGTTTSIYSTEIDEDSAVDLGDDYGTDEINVLDMADISTSSEVAGFEGWNVQYQYAGVDPAVGWKFSSSSDWGSNADGYWSIPDAQAGLKNPALKPWIEFHLHAAKTLRTWQFASFTDADRTRLIRLVEIFSSPDGDDWTFEGYFELPPIANRVWDCYLRTETSAAYWRVCIRSKWQETFSKEALRFVRAYQDGRHYWANGWVKFRDNTLTEALRGVRAPILQSFLNYVYTGLLPASPQDGDVFSIERGCPRTLNACFERKNQENYGGFDPIIIEQLAH